MNAARGRTESAIERARNLLGDRRQSGRRGILALMEVDLEARRAQGPELEARIVAGRGQRRGRRQNQQDGRDCQRQPA